GIVVVRRLRRERSLELLAGEPEVGAVEERVPSEADVEEGRLDAREDARHLRLRDAPDRKRLAVPLDPDLDGRPALAKSRPGPPRAPTDEKLARHGPPPRTRRAGGRRSGPPSPRTSPRARRASARRAPRRPRSAP